MNTCTHPCVLPTRTGYVCQSCGQHWTQLFLIDTPTEPMPTPAPLQVGENSASNREMVASGNSQPPPIQLSLISASTDQPPVLAKYSHRVRTYKSHGKLYYRYTCNVGHAVTHDEHIPGGNVRSAVAKNRATQVKRWIDQGVPPDTIAQNLRQWRSPKRR